MNLAFLALERDEVVVGEGTHRATGIAHDGRHQYPETTAGGALDAAGGVHSVADRGVILTMRRRADEAYHRLSGMNANTDVEVSAIGTQLYLKPQQRLFCLASEFERAAGVIRLIRWCAPKRHDGIADIFVQRSLMTEEHFDLQTEIAVEQAHDR